MNRLARLYQFPYLCIVLWVLPMLVVGLFADQSLIAHDEGLYATRAKRMFDAGDWINPWENPHHKTPGVYWLMACFYQLFGVNEIAVRLPSLLLSFACFLLVYQIAKILIDNQIALWSVFILSLEFIWLRYSYLGNPDYVTISLFLASILCLLKHKECATSNHEKIVDIKQKEVICLFSFGCCLSLMILFRGFLAGMLILSLVPYLIVLVRQWKYWKQPALYIGFFVGLIPLALWLYLSFQRYETEILNSLFGLFVNLSQEQRRNNGYFYYVINILAFSFPWCLFAIIGAYSYWRKSGRDRFLLLGIPGSIFLMVTLYETRLSHYALPIYPFLAILAAFGIRYLMEASQRQRRSPKLLFRTMSSFFCLLGGILILINVLAIMPQSLRPFTSEIWELAYIGFPMGVSWFCLGIFAFQKNQKQKWFASLIIGPWLSFILITASGLLTDVNPQLKALIIEPEIQHVLQNNYVALLGDGKAKVLFRFYSPNVAYQVQSLDQVNVDEFAWVESNVLVDNVIEYETVGEYKSWQLIQRK